MQQKIWTLAFLVFISATDVFSQNPVKIGVGYKQKGIISYYTERFSNRETASGEKFDNNDLVGSHPKLPFNSKVKITNLGNSKTVVIRVNDRGPYAYGRIMDISLAAAKKIDLIATGTAKVELEVLSMGESATTPVLATEKEEIKSNDKHNPAKNLATSNNNADYAVGNTYTPKGEMVDPIGFGLQVGAFNDIKTARTHCAHLVAAGFGSEKMFIQVGLDAQKMKKFKVLVGEFEDKIQCESLKNRLLMQKFNSFPQKHER
ncbi:MAG: septal ring lytic transglycosylase RlpA family protein [Microscillaceae bacterium]|jgi:rare lipoprotein A|nr:septal ring lytic transglycosylase RlpA family protein [Microscillaceae bacterium]